MSDYSLRVLHRPFGPWRGRYVLLKAAKGSAQETVSHHWSWTRFGARRKAILAAARVLQSDFRAVYRGDET